MARNMNQMNEDPRLLEMAACLAGLNDHLREGAEIMKEMIAAVTEKDQQIALLKEQIRVADVAFQHLFKEHKALQTERDELVGAYYTLLDGLIKVCRREGMEDHAVKAEEEFKNFKKNYPI